MTHLTDMEELVASVQNDNIRSYMSEALSCYMTGAYRASVVLTFIALFDDILTKLGELAKVNKKARNIHVEASKRRVDQEVYETYLIDQLRANSLLPSLDTGFLEILRGLRNKAAHPSGHHASAEEARFVFFEATSRFLSKPILSTTQLADQILASLSDENLFPSHLIKDTTLVVKKEVQHLHPQVFPYLVNKLIEKTRDGDSKTSRNCRMFLNGLARVGDSDASAVLKKRAIVDLASSKPDALTLLGLLCADGKLFSGLDEVTYQRIIVLFSDRMLSVTTSTPHTSFSHPISVLFSLLSSNDIQFVIDKFGEKFTAFLDRFSYSAFFTKFALQHEKLRKLLLDKLYEKSGSSDFGTANGFVKYASDLEKVAGKALSPEEAFRILVNVIKAAEIGAYAAVDMRNGHFGDTPLMRAKSMDLLTAEPATSIAIAESILGDHFKHDSLKWIEAN